MTTLSRRGLIAAALTLPVLLPAAPATAQGAPPAPGRLPRHFLRIGADGAVTCILPTSEMGQGTHTGQAQILAEELGADWASIRIEMPDRVAPEYRATPMRQMRSAGSYGIRYWHDPLRRAAAQARMMLTEAAASRLGVPAEALFAAEGAIHHRASGRSLAFAELAEAAARLPVPAEPRLRPATERSLTGRPVPRLDTPAKVAGRATFAADVRLPGMLYGALRLAPVFSADLAAFDPASIANMPGVVTVARVPRGAVVIAESWWQARQAADALDITFTTTPHDAMTSADIAALLRAGLAATDVPVSLARGDPDAALAHASRIVEADYAVPMLAHVPMEPLAGTARDAGGLTELWLGTQGHDEVRIGLERALGVAGESLRIHTTFLGGGFGRKSSADIAIQAVLASRAVGGRPVKVQWTRAEDIGGGEYRQTMMARFRAGLDAAGRIVAMTLRVSGPQMGRAFGMPIGANNIDPFSLSGLVDMRYGVPNLRLDHAVVPLPVAFRPWRSIAHSFTAFFLESFMDECAAAAGQDPLAFRRAHLQDQPRMLAVLDRAAGMARWGEAPAPGLHRGIAVAESYGSVVAQVVDLRMDGDAPRVARVHVAIDCGRAINPGQVEAQMQGSVIEALGAALHGRITVAEGRAEQSNFHDYPLPRINEVPEVRVAIVEIGSPLGGAGESGVPPLAPALAGALHAATGQRFRSTPFFTMA
jgi:isoquinoline 1-oxidoreductase beta subunit